MLFCCICCIGYRVEGGHIGPGGSLHQLPARDDGAVPLCQAEERQRQD